MKMLLPALVVGLLLLSACGSDDGPSTATDPGSDAPSRPTAVPAAPGTVHTRGLVTVMDTGSPELCLGPVAESFPPQCGGPALAGWDWSEQKRMYEQQDSIRWGSFAVTGTWDGETFTYESAIPAALYDAMVEDPPAHPEPSVEHTEEELTGIAEDVGSGLPGAQGAYAHEGRVHVDVIYDDGSLQAWADETYGAGVVVVSSMLVDEA